MAVQIKQGFNIQESLHIDPEKLDEFFEALGKISNIMHDEPECTFFEAYQDPDDPTHIRLVQNWTASIEWFVTVRVKRDYVQELIKLTDPFLTGPRDYKIFNRLEGFYGVKKEDGLKTQ